MVDSISKTPVDFEVAAAIVGDAFCEFVGTGGTFAGISRFLKAKRPAISCYIIEPAGFWCWPVSRWSIRLIASKVVAIR